MPFKKWSLWLAWAAITLTMAAYLVIKWKSEDRALFLPGSTTHGHYQIELRCDACHTSWNGVKEDACYNCHAAELKLANDSHPKSKFTDPRNADRLTAINAADCVTCHREHVPRQTRAMGVTVADDFCYHCHQQTLVDRPSHKDFAFNSCAAAGCHNYHDNTALYEDFLRKHLKEPDEGGDPHVPLRLLAARLQEAGSFPRRDALQAAQQDAPASVTASPELISDWARTAHANAGVNCSDCHELEDPKTKTKSWSDKLSHSACQDCHAAETEGFLASRHGMRLAQGLSPMEPSMARLSMRAEAAGAQLGCASCHQPHQFDTRAAAVDACLNCHNDSHSRAYRESPHYELWKAEIAGEARAGSGVSCATCHLPRLEKTVAGSTHVFVEHNQNANLRPNEKMVRQVCMECHGLEFTLNALADTELIQKNFRGRPATKLETLRLVEERSRQSKPK